MSTELVTGQVWPRLTGACREARQRGLVAVAYFGKGAAKLVPLRAGSKLVVDASDNAVKSGQTHPADLLELHAKGVRIFSYPNLHSKVYVLDRTAAIGSANASQNSSRTLLEAVVLTNDRLVVTEARAFVVSIAKNELGPLQKIYRPPRLPSLGMLGASRKSARQVPVPNIRAVHLVDQHWSNRDRVEQEAGEKIAERYREHGRSWKTECFRWLGPHSFKHKERVLMITRKGARQLVDPPGKVLCTRSYATGKGRATFIYLELRHRRRRDLKSVAKHLGRSAMKRLARSGVLNRDLSGKLSELWEEDR
jgi:hypothetical protein